MGNLLQKFTTVNRLHKDKINTKIFKTVFECRLVIFSVLILRCVICSERRSRRIKSSSNLKRKKNNY